MTARRVVAVRLVAFAGTVLTAAACVEISSAEQGVLAIRLEPLPPSIIAGDTLRDSTGAVLRLRATAFAGNGDTVPGAPFRFLFVPISRDTLLSDNRALVVDS
ncbi:MAG: hypothetical protein ACXWZS_16765, partial [Gemmatirosa sp.]